LAHSWQEPVDTPPVRDADVDATLTNSCVHWLSMGASSTCCHMLHHIAALPSVYTAINAPHISANY